MSCVRSPLIIQLRSGKIQVPRKGHIAGCIGGGSKSCEAIWQAVRAEEDDDVCIMCGAAVRQSVRISNIATLEGFPCHNRNRCKAK
jgi:hypothetical protein